MDGISFSGSARLFHSISYVEPGKRDCRCKVCFRSDPVSDCVQFFGLARAEEYEWMKVGAIYERSAAYKNGGGAVGGFVCQLLTSGARDSWYRCISRDSFYHLRDPHNTALDHAGNEKPE